LFIFDENTYQGVLRVDFLTRRKPLAKMKTESCMNDLEANILTRIRKGDINEFEHIVNKYKDKAFALTIRILKNNEDAEDSLQEAFIKTFRAIVDNRFEERSKFSTYFYRIVYNTALDFYKRHKSKNYNLISMDSGFNKPESDEGDDFRNIELQIDEGKNGTQRGTDSKVMEGELQDFVNRFLGAIPEKYSVILTLFYMDDLSHDEIADVMHLPLGTVKNRIFRAKEKLKEMMVSKYSPETIMELI
jgi:RNA polymerase sigma-70 factor (ECF subfamily)